MIYEGLVEEGFSIVKGARDRYDGVPRPPIPRSPWNEIECGGHYARAMSSWSLLLAVSGCEIDGPRGALRFQPRCAPESFKCFICGPDGWGSFLQKVEAGTQRVEIAVKQGKIVANSLQLRLAQDVQPKEVVATMGDKRQALKFVAKEGSVEILFDEKLTVNEGKELAVTLA